MGVALLFRGIYSRIFSRFPSGIPSGICSGIRSRICSCVRGRGRFGVYRKFDGAGFQGCSFVATLVATLVVALGRKVGIGRAFSLAVGLRRLRRSRGVIVAREGTIFGWCFRPLFGIHFSFASSSAYVKPAQMVENKNLYPTRHHYPRRVHF